MTDENAGPPCDDPSWEGTPGPMSHDYGKWSKPQQLHENDRVKFRVRVCSRCDQQQHEQAE